jgi:hypothetical protein
VNIEGSLELAIEGKDNRTSRYGNTMQAANNEGGGTKSSTASQALSIRLMVVF